MKTAITSTGNHPGATIDQRFARCAWFVIYDDATQSADFIANPNLNATEGAGPAAVQFLAGHKIGKIVSGEFGAKIKPLLDNLKIQMIVLKQSDKTIGEIIQMLDLQTKKPE